MIESDEPLDVIARAVQRIEAKVDQIDDRLDRIEAKVDGGEVKRRTPRTGPGERHRRGAPYLRSILG